MNLSEISEALNLAPSTVSQHLVELERDGAIARVDNPYIRKWKYYKLNNDDDINHSGGKMQNNKILWYGIIAVLIIAVAGAALSMSYGRTVNVLPGSLNVPLSLTDPPHVPAGTTALQINYSSVEVHLSSASNASGWLTSNAAGTVNLISLVNVSQAIGNVSIPANATVNMVRFDISSASITVNGTLYNVTVPSSKVTAHVEGSLKGTSGILLDLSPTVAMIFTQNSTIFVMVPSLRAVVVSQANTTVKVGERRNLNRNESGALEAATPVIGISNASISVDANTTSLSITVKNNANQSVLLKHILVFGNESATITARAHRSISINSSIANISVQAQKRPSLNLGLEEVQTEANPNANLDVIGVNTSLNATVGENASANANSASESHASTNSSRDGHGNVSIDESHSEANSTALEQNNQTTKNETESEGINRMNITVVARTIQSLRTINFLVQGNSTALVLPAMEGEFSGEGYSLAAGSSVTFTFIGNISAGESNIVIKPIAGESYRIVAIGEESAFASANVTAS